MIVCAFDLETTGLDSKKDRIIELGAVFFDTASFKIIDEFSTFIWDSTYPKITEEITDITGITLEQVMKQHLLPEGALRTLLLRIENIKPAAFIAHNAQFDKGFLLAEAERCKIEIKLPFVCSMRDFIHPEKFKCKKLSHLALDYGVPINPEDLHRAVGDIHVMIKMLEKMEANFEDVLSRAHLKDIVIRAVVPPPFGPKSDGGVGKDKAKSLGYNWNNDTKIWTKTVKEDQVEKEQNELGYRVIIVG